MIPKTLSNILARRLIEDPQQSIFFVGYANPESPGVFYGTREQMRRLPLTPTNRPAGSLQYRTVSIQRARHARGAHRLRQETFAWQNCSCARRSTGGGVDAGYAVSRASWLRGDCAGAGGGSGIVRTEK